MWFKNLQIRRIPAHWTATAEQMEQWLAPHAFQQANSIEKDRCGWVSPRDNGSLVYLINRQMLLTYRAEKKLLPGTVITQFTKIRAQELEEQQGFKPGRKQMRELKEQVTDELLPRAFSICRDTRVWIDTVNGWLVIDAASQAVAERPSRSYNPLFLYGGVGMGKTHLMQAVGHLIKQRNPAMRLTYISAEKFTNEVINSLRFDRMISFRDRFRTVDVLLVDDIQFIAGKERTQEEFFHTFNALYEQQKQIIVSSDCPPKEISSIEERLRSRFEWGLIADIQPPDLETKIAILQKKAESERVHLPDEVAEFIARSIKSNVRELEGALTRLIAFSSLSGGGVNLPTAQQVLKNIIATQEKKVTIELIQRRVGEQFGLREQDLKVRSNTKAIAFPRQIAMYLVKQLTSASLPEIGRQFGGKHHTTVLHSIHKIDTLRRSDKELNRTINRLLDSFE